MFPAIKRMTGFITVEETNREIIVEGVPSYFIVNDIGKIWRTSKIAGFMFNKVTRNSFRFDKFFAIDILYILQRIAYSKERTNFSKRTANQLIEQLLENTWLRDTVTRQPDILDFSKVGLFYKTPMIFQEEFLKKYNEVVPRYHLNGYMLAGAPGVGKSLMSMMLGECRRADFIMVVCPNNAVHRVWRSSIENEYKDPPTYWIAGEDKPYNNQRYLVAHYEALYKLLEVAKNVRGRIVIILDESHNLNEINSQRTQNFIQLCKLTRSRDIIWASGTPIKALGSESIPFFTTIDPFFTDIIREKFKKIYGKDATKSIDILSNRIHLTSHKIEKKELKLADPIIENFPVVVPNGEEFTLDSIKKDMVAFIEERTRYYAGRKQQDYQFYDKCLDYFENSINDKNLLSELQMYKRYVGIVKRTQLRDCKDEVIFCNRFENTEIMPVLPAEWRKDFKDVKSVVKYVGLKIQGECLGRVLGKKRMDCIAALSQSVDYIKYIESTVKKTLIFTSYVEVIEKTKEKLLSIGLNPLVVYAKTNKDLNDIITRFDKDESLNPLVATFASLSTAVPLVMADTMIMLNTPFRDYVHQQAISRIHRLGSDTQVYVYIAYLDTGTKPNLSTRTVDILKWSQTAVEAIMGIKSPFEIEELKVSTESIDNRSSYYDIGVNMVELGIEERFEFDTYVQESKGRPGYLNW